MGRGGFGEHGDDGIGIAAEDHFAHVGFEVAETFEEGAGVHVTVFVGEGGGAVEVVVGEVVCVPEAVVEVDLAVYFAGGAGGVSDGGGVEGGADLDVDVAFVVAEASDQVEDIGVVFFFVDVVDAFFAKFADFLLAFGNVAGVELVADGDGNDGGSGDEVGEGDAILAVGEVKHF